MSEQTTALQELRDVIYIDVQGGFLNRQEIIEVGIDFLLGDFDYDWIEANATRITDELLALHYNKQKHWTGETDCDRLDEAFAELDRNGIVARHNFTCCQTCGHMEISYAVEETELYHPVHGYVFYHLQDLENVVRDRYLYLAYGAVSGKEEESVQVGHEICEALRKHGLEPDWSGSVKTRICLRNLLWWRRRNPEGLEINDNV